MEVRSNCNTSFGVSPQSNCSSRSAQSRELQKFLTTQTTWEPPGPDFDDDDFLTATWQGDTLVGKDGESVVASIEPLERTKQVIKSKKQQNFEKSSMTRRPLRRQPAEPIPENTCVKEHHHRFSSHHTEIENEIHNPRGQVLQQIRHRHNSSKSRSPGPQRRKSLNRAKSERLPKSSTSLDTHLITSDEVRRQYPDKPCDQPGPRPPHRSKSVSPISPQGSSTADLTDEDTLTIVSKSSGRLLSNHSSGSFESDTSRRTGLQRAHSECLLKALRQKTKTKMDEIEEHQEYIGPLRTAPNTRTRRSCSPTAGGRSRSPRHASRPHNPLGPSPKRDGPFRIPTKANTLRREQSLSPSPEEDVSPPTFHNRRLSRAMSEKIQSAAKVRDEQRLSLHRAPSKRGLSRHPSMSKLAAERSDSLREVFDWNGQSSSSSLLSDDCTPSQSSCARSQSSQRSRSSTLGQRVQATSADTPPPMLSLKRSSSSDYPKNMTPNQPSFSSRRGSVGMVESVPLETSLSRRKSAGLLTMTTDGAPGRFTPRNSAGDKVLSRRPSLRRMASNSSMDRREMLKRTGSNSSIDQYQITPTLLRRSSSSVNRQAAHSLFYDNLRNSQRNLYEEVNGVTNHDATKMSLRLPCSKEEAMTFHGILKDVSASKQVFNSMLSK